MQTRFSAAQLADPQIREADRILRSCVHCGFCTATCPTYLLLGDELDSPRGRIYLIKDMLENERPATPEVVRHIDRCLSCLACMTTCPSGVHYQHLVDHARVHIEHTYRRPWRERWTRRLLAAVLPYPRRFAALMRLAVLLKPVGLRLPVDSVRAAMRLVPDRIERSERADEQRSLPGEQQGASLPVARPRVAVLEGCVESVLAPRIHASAIRLLTLAGADPVSVPGCCGAIVHHLGRAADNRRFARALTERLRGVGDEKGFHAIVTTASGCGTHLKDYGWLFNEDAELSERTANVAERARDITEVLDELGLPPARDVPALRPAQGVPALRVAYHSACSMQHGQRVHSQPRALLENAGFTVCEIAEGHLCCGSAGTYNLLQPKLADKLRDRKLDNIDKTEADIVATGNIGCITQLAISANRPVVHTVELLDWALGGPRPRALKDHQPRPHDA